MSSREESAPRNKRIVIAAGVSVVGTWLHPVLHLAERNRYEVDLQDAWRTGLWAACVGLLPIVVAAIARRGVARTALLWAATPLLLGTFEPLRDFLFEFLMPLVGHPTQVALWTIPVWGVVAVFAVVLLSKVSRPERALGPIAGAVVVLCAQPAWKLAFMPSNRPSGFADNVRASVPRRLADAKPPADNVPDLIVLVLDAYGRDDLLRKVHGIDNRGFLDALRTRGFLVSPRSHGNYNQTVLCLSSAFNLDYLETSERREATTDLASLAPSIDRSRLRALLERRGLRMVGMPTGMPLTDTPTADWVVSEPGASSRAGLSGLEETWLATTPFGAIPRTDIPENHRHRRRVEFALDALPRVAAQPWGKFVFVHAMVPHPPFLFGAHGEAVDPPGGFTFVDGTELAGRLTKPEYSAAYGRQLAYTNRRVLETLDSVERRAARPTIIVVMGDHGSRMGTDWDRPERTDARESVGTLLAVRFPEPQPGDARALENAGPVNALRYVLSSRYGENLPPLPEKAWYSGSGSPFALSEVPEPWRRVDDAPAGQSAPGTGNGAPSRAQ